MSPRVRKLSASEMRLYNFIRGKGCDESSILDIADFFYEGGEKPVNWRNCVTVFIRNLNSKLEGSDSVKIIRTTPLGRGNLARYRIGPSCDEEETNHARQLEEH